MKKIKKTKPSLYKLQITLGGQTLIGNGDTALIALRSIKPPVKIFTKGQIEMTYGDKKVVRSWMPSQLKRLFYPLAQPVLSKQLDYLMK